MRQHQNNCSHIFHCQLFNIYKKSINIKKSEIYKKVCLCLKLNFPQFKVSPLLGSVISCGNLDPLKMAAPQHRSASGTERSENTAPSATEDDASEGEDDIYEVEKIVGMTTSKVRA